MHFNRLLKPTKLPNGSLYYHLTKHNNVKRITAHKLVFQHFKQTELNPKYWIHHKDFNKENNHSPNLNQKSRGDYLRLWNIRKNRIRGVYKYKQISRGKLYEKWRAVLKHKNKVKTIGYFQTQQEAEKAFCEGYQNMYGVFPYTNRFLEYQQ